MDDLLSTNEIQLPQPSQLELSVTEEQYQDQKDGTALPPFLSTFRWSNFAVACRTARLVSPSDTWHAQRLYT